MPSATGSTTYPISTRCVGKRGSIMLGATNQPLHNSKALSEFIRFSSLLNNNIYIYQPMECRDHHKIHEEQARHVKHYTFLKLHGIII
uniref:Uncharacterized protein n=1 Tax=Oryza glumipatula TaxID=40148 RepID=A0A0E0BGS4_9ORYZ